MKKLFLLIGIILLSRLFLGYSHNKKCIKCIEEQKNNKTCMCEIGIAWRDYGTPIIHKDGKAYATYKCCYGHSFFVCLTDE